MDLKQSERGTNSCIVMSGKYNLQTDYFDENKLNSEIKKYLKDIL